MVQTAVAQMAEQSTQADGSLCKDSGVVKVRVTSVERPGDESGRSRVRCSLASGRRNRSKDRPLQLGAIAQETNTTRADGSHRKRKEHSRFEAHREQEWLCYWEAGMVKSRDTSRQERG